MKGKSNRSQEENNKNTQNLKQISKDVFCLFCGEKYGEPPTKDWVQRSYYSSCARWLRYRKSFSYVLIVKAKVIRHIQSCHTSFLG